MRSPPRPLRPPAVPFRRPAPLPTLVPIERASEALGLSTRTLRRRIADGTLAACRINGRLYLRPEDIQAFIHRHLLVPGS